MPFCNFDVSEARRKYVGSVPTDAAKHLAVEFNL